MGRHEFSASRTAGDDHRLRRMSRRLALASALLALGLPLATAYGWWSADPAALIAAAGAPPHTAPAAWQWALAGALALLPATLFAAALWAARRCFTVFAGGAFLSAAAVRALRAFAGRAAAAGFAGLLVPTLLGLVLTAANPPGDRVLTLAVGSSPLLAVLFGATVWAIAAVLDRAVAIADDHALIV